MIPAAGKEGFPTPFGRYTLTERLATGGMAEVFRAKITAAHGFEKQLVIKRILPNLAADKNFVSMFIDEAKLTAQLIHPKIVQVIDFGEVRGQYFIALEFIDGFDALALLRAAAVKHLRLPMPIAMFVAMEVLDALDFAHNAVDHDGRAMRLVHRDISPSNVFISRRGDVKLGDFGIAHAQKRESKTQAGTLKGKYGYMSPEQVMGNVLDARSDIFAVGIVLAEMLMGRRLFTAPNDLDVLLMVRDGRLERLDKHAKDLPPELDEIVRRALAKRVEDRFQSAAEFRDALGDLLFRWGKRVTPSDLGRLAMDLLDQSPEAGGKLAEQLRRWKLDASMTGSGPAAAGLRDSPGSVAAVPFRQSSSVASSSSAAGLTPSSWPRPPSRPQGQAAPPSPDDPLVVDVEPGSTPGTAGGDRKQIDAHMAAIDSLMSLPLSVVDLDKYQAPGGPGGGGQGGGGAGVSAVSLAPGQPPGKAPESVADLGELTPIRLFTDLVVGSETGLLRFELPGQVRDVYLVGGAPESVDGSAAGERLAQYLITRGLARPEDLEKVKGHLPRFGGKLPDTIAGLGLMRAPDVLRLQAEQVREQVVALFSHERGRVSFYRGLRNALESATLSLDPYEIIGAGVLTLSLEALQNRFRPLLDFRPVAFDPPRVLPEAFHLGPTPRDLWVMLDGTRSLRAWLQSLHTPDERVTFLRTLYLLVEVGLAGVG